MPAGKNSKRKAEIFSRAFWCALVLALIPWLLINSNLSINADNAWMVECLRRYFGGLSMAEGFYEPNPPWALVPYIPIYLLSLAGIPIHYAIYLWGVASVALGGLAVHAILSRWKLLDSREAQILTASFIIGTTVATSTMFAERDHFVAMALVPFVLLQVAQTFEWPQPPRAATFSIFFIGALLILLKPYHLLIPGLILAWRVLRRRQISFVFKEPDFISLAVALIVYLAYLFILFPDYVRVILPDVASFYYTTADYKAIGQQILQYAPAAGVLVLAGILNKKKEQKTMLTGLGAAALLSLIPYILQRHGFYYPLLPAVTFLWMGLGFLILLLIRRETNNPIAALIGSGLFVGVAAYAMTWQAATTTHEQYRQLPLVQTIRQACTGLEDCSFFIFNMNLEIAQKLAYYAQAPSASRFPSFWVLPPVLEAESWLKIGDSTLMSAEKIENYRKAYARMTAEDLQHYKPPIALIGRFEVVDDTGIFNLPDWFKTETAFANEWSHYTKTGTIEVPFDDYLEGSLLYRNTILTFDVYERTQ